MNRAACFEPEPDLLQYSDDRFVMGISFRAFEADPFAAEAKVIGFFEICRSGGLAAFIHTFRKTVAAGLD